MIVISDPACNVQKIIGGYHPSSIEGRLLKAMHESRETYRFRDLNDLNFELLFRRETVNAARELNKSGLSFAVFRKSRCNENYWDRTPNGGFRLKRGVKPHAAINDIRINGRKYATECATAMVIVYYLALLNIFKKEQFDELFADIYLMNWSTLDPLLAKAGKPIKVTDILIGDRAYFANPDVNPKTPELQGENVIVMPGNLYYGHGVGITTGERIIRMLNSNRREGATQSAHLLGKAGRPDYKSLADVYYRKNPGEKLYCTA